jgi:hypothetical protein
MALRIRRVSYFYLNVPDRPGEAYKLLALLSERGINMHAFTAVPVGEARTQLSIVPEDPAQLVAEASRAGLALDRPNSALLVQGDDELGALADLHRKLFEANVNVYMADGVSDGRGAFGYLLYIRPEEFERAVHALGL